MKATSRAAKAAGDAYYFTGKPCRRGHVAKRFASTRHCVQCDRTDAAQIERRRNSVSRWKKQNPGMCCQQDARRRAAESKATPSWNNDFIMAEAYDLAGLRTKLTGLPWSVDHIVPLRSPLVCGLHAHTNVRVITSRENSKKSNRSWPGMP